MHPPETLLEGKYEILNKMREGGMGTIYLVRHRLLDKVRVIKVMRPQIVADPELKRRFIDEAKMATRLSHPNICTIHDFALDDDATAYLVMEFIEGVNLADLIALHGPPGLAMSLEIAHQALLALAYLHRNRIVHRDVAPDNLMLTSDDEGRPLIKLIDLGIAKADDGVTERTRSGVFLGKLRYASPEQFGTLSPPERIDGRSDLYSLAVVLYELLTGARPVRGDTPAELLHGHVSSPPVAFSVTDPGNRVPSELRDAILKALQKRREDRYQLAREFDQDVLLCQARYTQPGDLAFTMKTIGALPRVEVVTAKSPTPGLQGRIDRRFGAQTTPRPSREITALTPSNSRVSTETIRESESGTRAHRRRSRWLIAGAALVAAVAAILVSRIGAHSSRAREAILPAASTSPPAAAPEPTAQPTLAAAASEATPREPTAPPADAILRRELDSARASAFRARRASEQARAPELAAESYSRARAQEVEAQRLEARGLTADAKAGFELSARLYAQSAASARTARTAPSPIAVAAVQPTPELRLEPSPRAAISPSEAKPPPTVPPAPAAAAGSSDQDRIRETLHAYERAQSTLDAELYVRIFPALDRKRIARAFSNLASQTVEFEIRRIQIDSSGTGAEVSGYEKRVAVPQVGTPQRVNGDRTMRLEKRGEAWVITQLN